MEYIQLSFYATILEILTMTKRRKALLGALILIPVVLLAIIVILPPIAKTKVIEALQQETGRKARIESIRINPLTMTITVDGFALQATGAGDLVSIKQIRTSLSPLSLFKGAAIISELTITEPTISFGRSAPNRYNFSDIMELQQKKPKKEPGAPLHFSLSAFRIVNGSINFDDQGIKGGKQHTVRNLEITIPIISNIPQQVETATAPRLSALVNGSPFSLSGAIKPFSKSFETSLSIDLKNVNLPEYVSYVPMELPVTIPSGKLTVAGEINYRISATKQPELTIKGKAGLTELTVNSKQGESLLKLPSLQLQASSLDLMKQRFVLDSLLLNGVELNVSRDTSGRWFYQHLLPQPKVAKNVKNETTAVAAKQAAPLVEIHSFGIHDSQIRFNDRFPQGGFSSRLEQIDLDVTGFSTAADATAEYDLSLLMDQQTDLSVNGSFSPSTGSVTASADISGLNLQRWWPYYQPYLSAPLKGNSTLSGNAAYSKQQGFTLDQLNISLKQFAARYGTNEQFQLGSFNLNNGRFSANDNRFEAALVQLTQGDLPLSKEADGSISILTLLRNNKPTATKTATKTAATTTNAATTSKKAGKEFSWKLDKLALTRCNLAFTDKTRADAPRFTLTRTDLNLAHLTGPRFTPSPLTFSSTFNKATPLSANGVITPAPFHYQGSVNIGRLPLRDFESYFPENINVFIVGGNAETAMNVDISLKDGKAFGNFKGSAALRSFHAVDTKAEEDLLKWESLQLDDIQGTLEPFSLALHQIALNSVYSRIIIRKDGTLNLQNLVEKPQQPGKPGVDEKQPPIAAPPKTPEVAGTAEASTSASQPPPKKQIRVDAVTIQDGTLAFTDNHLPQHFETTFFNLGGRVSGLSSEDSKFADVDLRGNLENHSPLLITGKINPLRDDLFVDLKVSFRDIELSPITPYTATFLGYPVEKGKLFLDLKYLIDKKKLDSENKVFIDQFTLGDKVASDQATSLPVKLGLALLKDRKGEIHLDLPVTGRTDDPKFSIWGVVWQVVKNLLVKAATSPFALLSSMFGGSGEDFSSVQFVAGSNAISVAEEQKLTTLAKALLDRPALKMELKGYVDRERDTEDYREELLNRKIKNEKILALSAQGTVVTADKRESIEISQAEYPEFLKSVYKKEKFPKPRNAIGLVKDLPPDEMKKLIIANTVIGDKELQALARERVVAVFNHLITKGNVPVERIFQKNDDVYKAPEKSNSNRSRVEITAIAQ